MTLEEAFHTFDQVKEQNGHAVPYCCGLPVIQNSRDGVNRIVCPACGRAVREIVGYGWHAERFVRTQVRQACYPDPMSEPNRDLADQVEKFQAESRAARDVNRADKVTPQIDATIADMFEYHAWDQEMTERGTRVRAALAAAVAVIVDNVPAGPDRSVAIRKIREARMDCNSAITHEGRY